MCNQATLLKVERRIACSPPDLILPPRSGKISIGAYCVENGRWSQRGNESATVFNSSSNTVASREVKLAAKMKQSQGEVWKRSAWPRTRLSANVGTRVNGAASPTSFQLALENKEVQTNADSYVSALDGLLDSRPDVIGYVFAINGKINSADVYASSSLFRSFGPSC